MARKPARVSIGEYAKPLPQRPEVDAMIKALIDAETSTDSVCMFFSRLQADYNRRDDGFFPPQFNYHDEPPDEPDENRRNIMLAERRQQVEGKCLESLLWPNSATTGTQLFWAIRDWRDAIHHARQLIETVAPLMNDPGTYEADKWSCRLRETLSEVGGCIPINNWSILPALDDATLVKQLTDGHLRIGKFRDRLKMIGPAIPTNLSCRTETGNVKPTSFFFAPARDQCAAR